MEVLQQTHYCSKHEPKEISTSYLKHMRHIEGKHVCTGMRVTLEGCVLSIQTSTGYQVTAFQSDSEALKNFRVVAAKKKGRPISRNYFVTTRTSKI